MYSYKLASVQYDSLMIGKKWSDRMNLIGSQVVNVDVVSKAGNSRRDSISSNTESPSAILLFVIKK